jgi:hypothetical protein
MLIAWGLWFGANISVFVFGLHFFNAMPKDAARESARAMFQAYGPYELGLAGLTALLSIGLVALRPSRINVLLVALVVMGLAMVVTQTLGIMQILEKLHEQGNVGTPEWLKWHIKSMKLNGMQAILLLITGLALMLSIRQGGEKR